MQIVYASWFTSHGTVASDPEAVSVRFCRGVFRMAGPSHACFDILARCLNVFVASVQNVDLLAASASFEIFLLFCFVCPFRDIWYSGQSESVILKLVRKDNAIKDLQVISCEFSVP